MNEGPITHIAIKVNGTVTAVPVTAWLGLKGGRVITWYPTRAQGDTAIGSRKVDATMPASNWRQR